MDNLVQHTGVVGMKWGRRKGKSKTPSSKKRGKKLKNLKKKKYSELDRLKIAGAAKLAAYALIAISMLPYRQYAAQIRQKRSDRLWNNPNPILGEVVEW